MKKIYEWIKDFFISHDKQLESAFSAFDKVKNKLVTMEEKIASKIAAEEQELKDLLASIENGKLLKVKATTVKDNIGKLLGE